MFTIKPTCTRKTNDIKLHVKCTQDVSLLLCALRLHEECACIFGLHAFWFVQAHVLFHTFRMFHWQMLGLAYIYMSHEPCTNVLVTQIHLCILTANATEQLYFIYLSYYTFKGLEVMLTVLTQF